MADSDLRTRFTHRRCSSWKRFCLVEGSAFRSGKYTLEEDYLSSISAHTLFQLSLLAGATFLTIGRQLLRPALKTQRI